MRFSLIFFAFVFTSAAQAQFIVATIFAVEIIFEIASTIAGEAAVAEVATSAEIAMTEVTAGELTFAAVNADRSATVVSGVAGSTLVGAESARLFVMGEKSLTQVGSTKFLTKNFVWRGLQITEGRGQRFWNPVITGTIKSGFKQEGGKLVTDGASVVIKRAGDAGGHIVYGAPKATGGYKVNVKQFTVSPRPLASQ
ncbi:uncharacterized protein J3D65DRAFT_664450 [Phyllosticta citribraziliensis]|uniref:Uncharacterized protein n=1 Tax=Phyllosticta citribraziliensis TaxID=989973 RepID=A0ABR1M6X1_9PEZI